MKSRSSTERSSIALTETDADWSSALSESDTTGPSRRGAGAEVEEEVRAGAVEASAGATIVEEDATAERRIV